MVSHTSQHKQPPGRRDKHRGGTQYRPQIGGFFRRKQKLTRSPETSDGKLMQPNERRTRFFQSRPQREKPGAAFLLALASTLFSFQVDLRCVCVRVCVIFKEKIKCKHTFNKLSPLTPLPEGTIWCSFGHSRCPYGLPSWHELM